jgi:hypothetical protein
MHARTTGLALAIALLFSLPARAQVAAELRLSAPDAGPDPSADLRSRLTATEAQLVTQQSELDALSEREVATESKEEPLRFWGFMDMGINKFFATKGSLIAQVSPSTATTFVLGSVNLYLEARPLAHFSAFLETRLTDLPDGTVSATGGGLNSTQAWDFTSPGGAWAITRLGAIVLERAYLQWEQSDLFALRVGEILTPFGIWNIDHGTPTLIALMLPQFEVAELFPTHMLGLEALGTSRLQDWQLGYYAYLTNGRSLGEVSMTEDNKMVGGRVFATTSRPFRMTLGLSGFLDRFDSTTANSLGPFVYEGLADTAFDERGLGADVSMDIGALRLRSEFTLRNIVYDTGLHPSNGFGVYYPDRNDVDYYLLAAYQLPWLGLEPYLYGEIYRSTFPFGAIMAVSSVGLNIHFNAAAQIKAQFSQNAFLDNLLTWTHDTPGGATNDVGLLSARFVLAF